MSDPQDEQPAVTIDAEPAGQRAVDPPPEPRRERVFRTLMWASEDKRRPIVPAWARSRDDAAAGTRFLARHGAHVAAYHVTRSPKYVARLVGRAPVGVLRLVIGVFAFWWDREGAPLRRDAVERRDLDGYMKLTKERNARVRVRGIVVGAVCVALIALSVALLVVGPRWSQLVALVAVVAALGVLGTPPDRRVLDTVVNTTGAPVRLTADIVSKALTSLGIAGITQAAKAGPAVTFPAPISRDGPAWRADVDLPHGVTPGDVIDRRAALASMPTVRGPGPPGPVGAPALAEPRARARSACRTTAVALPGRRAGRRRGGAAGVGPRSRGSVRFGCAVAFELLGLPVRLLAHSGGSAATR